MERSTFLDNTRPTRKRGGHNRTTIRKPVECRTLMKLWVRLTQVSGTVPQYNRAPWRRPPSNYKVKCE